MKLKKTFPGTHSDPVMEVFKYYVDDLPRLLKDHKIDISKLQNVVLNISKSKEYIIYNAQVLDDREVQHEYLISVDKLQLKEKA